MATPNIDEMASKDVLFEAIRSIKKGHNKPNTARICSYLSRKYALAANRCIKAINHYSSTGDIVAVNIGAPAADLSYRVADPPSLDAIAALKGSMINKFVAELIINEPNYLTDGVPPSRLVSFVAQKQPDLSRQEILESIRAELALGNLDTFENGNYGYFPLDSSDEDEPEDKKRKLGTPPKPKPVPSTCPKGSPKPGPVPPKANIAKPVGAKAALEKRERKPVARFEDKEDRKENREERKENVKKAEEEEEERDEEVTRRRRLKKKKYVVKGEEFRPASKDFKVDVSLDRRARKRKEKKIFDPSAEESKSRRRGSAAQQGQSNTSPPGGATNRNGARKLISPGKKFAPGSSVKVGSGPGIQLPPGGRTNITPLVPNTVCYLCQTYGKRVKGVPEKLISCVKCSTSKAHISCLNDARAPEERPISTTLPLHDWTCAKCNWNSGPHDKTCVYCKDFKPGIYILECIVCQSGFHVPCHKNLIPPLSKQEHIVPDKFKCVRCEPPLLKASQPPLPVPLSDSKPDIPLPRPIVIAKPATPVPQPKVTVTQLKPKVASVAVGPDDEPPNTLQAKLGFNNNMPDPHPHISVDSRVPDCQRWSALDVFKYMSEHLIQEVCQQLLEAKVDGKDLLLLKRSDCVEMLDLPVGYGLKLWCQVQRLQTKKSDVELFYGEF